MYAVMVRGAEIDIHVFPYVVARVMDNSATQRLVNDGETALRQALKWAVEKQQPIFISQEAAEEMEKDKTL